MTPRPVLRALLATAALALLAACGDNRVIDRFDGSAWPDRRPRVPYPDGGAPVAIVSDSLSDTISMVDLRSPELIGRTPVGLDPVGTDGPHHVIVDEVRGVAYTAFSYPRPSSVTGPHGGHGNAQTPGVLAMLSLEDLRVLAQVPVERDPGDLVLTPDRTRIVVSHFNVAQALQPANPDGGADDRRAFVTVHDAETLARQATVRVGLAAHGMAVSPDSRTAYVTCYGSDELALVALDQLQASNNDAAVTRIPVGPGPGSGPTLRYGPYAATVSLDGNTVYVSTLDSREVRVFDVATRAFSPLGIALSNRAAFFPVISADGARMYMPLQPSGMARIDLATRRVDQSRAYTREECNLPHQVGLGPDGRYWVVCEGDHRSAGWLISIDPETLAPIGRVELGVYPDAVAFFTTPLRVRTR